MLRCRNVAQVFSHGIHEVTDLINRDIGHEEAADDLQKSMKGLFDYASKFTHSLERDKKKLLPPLKASKEDAVAAFAAASAMVNLVSAKLRRASLVAS